MKDTIRKNIVDLPYSLHDATVPVQDKLLRLKSSVH